MAKSPRRHPRLVSSGPYRVVPVGLLSSTGYQRLSSHAQHILLTLLVGSTSSFAGISLVETEALVRQTNLRAAEVESALAELEKKPSGRRSFIVRQGAVIWVRHALESDPVVQKSVQGAPNEDQRKGIERALSALPQDSVPVKKFRRYYHFWKGIRGGTVGGTVGGDGGGDRRRDRARTPASTPSPTSTPASTPTREKRENQEVALATGSNRTRPSPEEELAEHETKKQRARELLKSTATPLDPATDLDEHARSVALLRQAGFRVPAWLETGTPPPDEPPA